MGKVQLLNYRALEHVHPSPPPAEPTSTTLNHSITLDTFLSQLLNREKSPVCKIVTIGGRELRWELLTSRRSAVHYCPTAEPTTTVLLHSCTLNCPSSSTAAHAVAKPPPSSCDSRNLILLPNKSTTVGKQICPPRAMENFVKMTRHSTFYFDTHKNSNLFVKLCESWVLISNGVVYQGSPKITR